MTLTKIFPTGVAGIPGAGSAGDITCVAGSALNSNPGSTVTLVSRDGYTKVITIPFAAADTATQVAAKLVEAIKADKSLEMNAVATAEVVDVTQYRPGTAGDTTITLNAAAIAAGVTKTNLTGGVDATGDMQIIQAAIDAASPGDIIEMQWDAESGTPGTGTGVEEPWVFGGGLVDDFLLKTSRNGVKVGSSERLTVASLLGDFWDKYAPPAGRPSFVPKYGRCLDVDKQITLRGAGVDGEGVPKTKIHTETQFDYAAYKALHDVALAADAFGYWELWGQMMDAMTKLHLVVIHHERVSLETLHFDACQVELEIHHPVDMDNVHITENIGISVMSFTDPRSVYPNWSETNSDYTNPELSTVENCVFDWVNVGLVMNTQELTFKNNTLKTYNPAMQGVLGVWNNAFTPNVRADFIKYMRRALLIEGNTFDAHEMGRYGVDIEMWGDGPTVIFEDIVIRDNQLLNHPTVNPRGGWGMDIYVGSGAVARNLEISNNTITKSPSPIELIGYGGSQILDSSISGNTFDTTNFTDATHPVADPGWYYGAQIAMLRTSGIAISGNDFVDSLVAALESPDDWGEAAIFMALASNCQVFQPAGTVPVGQGGIKNHLIDYAGYNNRVVGVPAKDLIAPKGIGDLANDKDNNKKNKVAM